MSHRFLASAVLAAVVVACLAADVHAKAFKQSTRGTPALKSIEVLSFGPEGTLLIGDGAGQQIIAVATGDTRPIGSLPGKLPNIQSEIAARLGVAADGIVLLDMAVNPASGRAYLAVKRQADKIPVIVTVGEGGQIGELVLEDVEYARVRLPDDGRAPLTQITDVAWADERLIAAGRANEEFASKIFVASTPLEHDSTGQIHSAETYHIAHGRWETKAPMMTILPYQQDGKSYVVGAFGCTPIVKYPLEQLQAEAQVKGISVIELGSGNRPLDMFTYERDGRQYVLASTYRFHHDRRPISPGPYWTVRFDRSLLDEQQQVNEQAKKHSAGEYEASENIVMVDTFHGVAQMDQLNEAEALVLRVDASGRVDLERVQLP